MGAYVLVSLLSVTELPNNNLKILATHDGIKVARRTRIRNATKRVGKTSSTASLIYFYFFSWK